MTHPTRHPPTTPDDPRSMRVSWSMLRAHEECKQKSFQLRAGRRNQVGDLRSYFHGMVVDRVMQDWLRHPDRTPGAMPGMVEAAIGQVMTDAATDGDGVVRWRHLDDRAELTAFCVELVRRLEPILTELILPHHFDGPYRFKQPLRVPYLDGTPVVITLTGEMDLLTHPTGGPHAIWDLKGTRDDQYWRKVVGQLVFYDVAHLAATGLRSVEVGLIQPMCTQPVLRWAVTDDQRRAMQARIIAYCRDVWTGQRACKDGTSGCLRCVVRGSCERFAAPPGTRNTASLAGVTSLAGALRAHSGAAP